jgi:phosphoribosylamine-glycine ligase
MADDDDDYKVGPRPPLHTRFRQGQSGTRAAAAKRSACAAGRVLGVTALGPDLGGAREHAYTAVDGIAWPEGFCRRDIVALR